MESSLRILIVGELLNCLPILIYREGVHQPLGVPKLPSVTGEATAAAVHYSLLQWGICDKIKCISFDTTASNIGPRNGDCILIEQKMGKNLL